MQYPDDTRRVIYLLPLGDFEGNYSNGALGSVALLGDDVVPALAWAHSVTYLLGATALAAVIGGPEVHEVGWQFLLYPVLGGLASWAAIYKPG